MKRWIGMAVAGLLVGTGGVVGYSSVGSASHIDCEARPDHPQCPDTVCTGPAADKNPHCAEDPGTTDTTQPTTDTTQPTTETTETTTEPTTETTAAASGGAGGEAAATEAEAEVKGVTVEAEPEPEPQVEDADPADAEESQPRFTG